MTEPDRDGLAAEYVLGSLSVRERQQFQHHLRDDPDLQQAVVRWEERLSGLSSGEAPLAPPPEVWSRITTELDHGVDARTPGAVTVRAADGVWEELAEGVRKKRLLVDRGSGTESFLLRFAPGGCLPAHAHTMVEECLMLEGEIAIGDLQLGAGDYHAVASDVDHAEISSRTGGLLFVRGELRLAV